MTNTDLLANTGFPGAYLAAIFVLGAVGVVGLLGLWRATAGTTLRAAWWWALSVLAILVVVETYGAIGRREGGLSIGLLQYLAAAATFCPMMALLGAKRPQDRAWQAIVLSLWAVLLLPAAHWWLDRPSSTLHIWTVWRWFLATLLFVSLCNHLPTRIWAAAVAVVAGQVILLRNHLPLLSDQNGAWSPRLDRSGSLLALGLLVAAPWLVRLALIRDKNRPPGLNRLWRDFRDLYGVVWSLRVTGLINSYAQRYKWPVTLTWRGFVPAPTDQRPPAASDNELETLEPSLSADTKEALTKSLRTTLRRFVSPEWIDQRLGAGD